MIRVSAGTAAILGLENIKSLAVPTTGYFMTEGNCTNNCAFCAQGLQNSHEDNRLSRITWPSFSVEAVIESIEKDYCLKRLCFQVVDQPNWLEEVERLVKAVRKNWPKAKKPICLSCRPKSVDQIEEMFGWGVDKVSIALDACTKKIAREINRDWTSTYKLLQNAARRFPGRITTHLIIGLGESEKEAIDLMRILNSWGVRMALFAFTPIKGTKMEKRPQPPIGQYRRVQAARYLMEEKGISDFEFDNNNRLILPTDWISLLTSRAFQTSGCPDCNRPFYNERPGGCMYNYPWELTEAELDKCIAELGERT